MHCPNCGADDRKIKLYNADMRNCTDCGFTWSSAFDGKKIVDISDIASPDAPTITNERGGSQSHIPTRFDLIDGKAMFAMAAVLHEGAEKYGENNWRLISIEDHLNHALMHIWAYLAGDRTDDHLSHLLCRATFATGVSLQEPSFDSINVEVK